MGILKGKLEVGKNLEKIIQDLKENESGYTFPESLEFNLKLEPYLKISMPIYKYYSKDFGSTLYVKRISSKKDGFYVDISKVEEDYQWTRRGHPFEEIEEEILDLSTEDCDVVKLKYETQIKEIPGSLEKQIQEAIENEDYELAQKLKKKNLE